MLSEIVLNKYLVTLDQPWPVKTGLKHWQCALRRLSFRDNL